MMGGQGKMRLSYMLAFLAMVTSLSTLSANNALGKPRSPGDIEEIIREKIEKHNPLQVTLQKPLLISPQGDITTRKPTYQWHPVDGANRYGILVYHLSPHGKSVFSKFNIHKTHIHHNGKKLDYEAGYIFVVFAYNTKTHKRSPVSEGMSFKVIKKTSNQPPVASFEALPQLGPAPLTVDFDASTSHDPDGEIASYLWDFNHDGTFDTEGVSTDYTYTVPNTYTVTLRVTDNRGAPNETTRQITVTQPLPTTSLGANPSSIILGQSTALAWNSENADSCVIEPGIGSVPVNGSITVSPPETTTYTITATGPGGKATDHVLVTVSYPEPVVSISPSPDKICSGESSTLSWISANAESVTIDHGIGPVPVIGSIVVMPSKTTTYTVTGEGPGGTAADTVTVTVHHLPEAVISAMPGTIQIRESSILSWSSSHPDSCLIEPGIGSVAPNGSITVSPSETTTYTIKVTSPCGTATDSVTVQVNDPSSPPTVNISASPSIIDQGQLTTLTWTSTKAQNAYIDNDVGVVPVSGSAILSPEHTTTYTITVTGPTGSDSERVTVMVRGNPAPQPEGSFGDQYQDLVPLDATVESYDPKRFSLITGLVRNPDGSPIQGVSVTIHGHPSYGTASTNANGLFSIPVEGGRTLTVVYQKQGLLTAHRKVYVPWNDIAIAKTLDMIPEDSVATTLTFDGNANTVVTHQSTEVYDRFGNRSCTLVFSGDNRAYLVDEEGDAVGELETVTVRASEYTTPDSMPAILPPTSAYTYCAELSVDGAQRVRFRKPVIIWVNNFLGFDVGEIAPVGYYDRDRGVWVPSENGVIVRLLDTDNNGIVDALDADGDGQPNDLDNSGAFNDEVKGLENPQRYAPGSTFWRVAVRHFSPFDWNWPYGPPQDAIDPNPEGYPAVDQQRDEERDCRNPVSSFVEERSRLLHEDIPIPGTDLTLHYASNRVEGYKTAITVPASGNTVPASLKRIIAKVNIAGRTMEQTLDPLPNQQAEFIWDGLDQLGRPLVGSIPVHIETGFVYEAVYYGFSGSYQEVGNVFARAGDYPTAIPARQEVILWKRNEVFLNRAKGTMADGWTLSIHHEVSPINPSTLFKGEGTLLNNPTIITTIAGNGISGYGGDGGPAIDAWIDYPYSMAVDASGNVYFSTGCRIRKIDKDGIITTVAGNGTPGYSGDGGPATDAQLWYPHGITVDAQRNLYTAERDNYVVRKVDKDGIIHTVAGNGTIGYSGDGGPATDAQLGLVEDVAVDGSGNLYIADHLYRIRKVDTSGIITTVAGNGTNGYSGDGGLATDAQIGTALSIDVDKEGNLYIADHSQRIRKVDTSGIISTIAGGGNPPDGLGDGGAATQARFHFPYDVRVDAAGNIYIADETNHRVRKVDTSGIIATVAGSGQTGDFGGGYSGDGGPATVALLHYPHSVARDAAGTLYIADTFNNRIRKVGPFFEYAKVALEGEISFAESNGLGYIMAASGHHKRTIDLETGAVLYSFGYDQDKKLVSITDRFGNQVTIQRDGRGAPSAITSPYGLTTTLTIDANNHLNQITYPDGKAHRFEYTMDGLLTAKVEPKGNRFEKQYDNKGRLTDVVDEAGGHWRYETTSENGDILSEVTTGEGNHSSYLDHTYSTGEYTSTITGPTGAQTLFTQSADGLTVNKSLPCGMALEFKYDVDPEFKYRYVKEVREKTASGIERVTISGKSYQDTNSDNIPDLITETVTMNGNASRIVTDTHQAQKTIISPVGRIVTSQYDPSTLLPTILSIPVLHHTTYGYDSRGKLTAIKTNTRETALTYNSQGLLASIIDPENHTTAYTYDLAGRMTGINRPDGSSVGFAYDLNGNMTVLTNPSEIDHEFGYNHVNLNSLYQAPISGSYQYVYDKDRRLTSTIFPSGLRINHLYNKTRLVEIRTPEANIDFTYLCGEKMGSVTNGTDSISYGYEGSLLTSEALNGTLNQTLSYSYNNDFNVQTLTYGGKTFNYSYDNDGLLTGAGGFTISRDAQTGLPMGVKDDRFNLSRTFNGYGEVLTQDFDIHGSSLTSWNQVRDDNGRITQKTETVGGITSNYAYSYDPMGRLLTVVKNGSLVEQYQYGSNGTRTYTWNVLREISGMSFNYSDEDHLLIAGDAAYQYDLDGFLLKKIDGTDITSYDYSSRGELLNVTLPDGKVIQYVHDPLGRRIARKVNGVITEKYLWQGLTRLLAVYNGSDTLIMRFEYADDRMPFSMTMGASVYYLTYDQVGSLRVVADSAGNVVKRMDYDSFGNIINDTNLSFYIPFGFAGGHHDRDTALVRFGYRDYDPDTGRWTAKDPILFAGGDTDLYGYCVNDPVNLIDPWGQLAFPYHGLASLFAGLMEGYGWESFRYAWDSIAADFGSQSNLASDTIIHGMAGYDPDSGAYLPPEIAVLRAQQRVADEEACGKHGSAMHTLQDLETPWHAGWEWRGNNPFTNRVVLGHWFLDWAPTLFTLKATYDAYKASRRYLQQAR